MDKDGSWRIDMKFYDQSTILLGQMTLSLFESMKSKIRKTENRNTRRTCAPSITRYGWGIHVTSLVTSSILASRLGVFRSLVSN